MHWTDRLAITVSVASAGSLWLILKDDFTKKEKQ